MALFNNAQLQRTYRKRDAFKNGSENIGRIRRLFGQQNKGLNKEKPNGLFLARITWNKTRELIWRIYDPKITNEFLTDLIEKKEYPREFDYRIDNDEKWKLAEWYLKKHE